MLIAPAEERMWEASPTEEHVKMSDLEIDAKYESGEQRILTEINREKLPSFVEALKKHGYMNLRPFYQRRPRWNKVQQSRLIESFLINVPVPPIVLYEKEFGLYEVMDGQQRITAIQSFYENDLELTGLELWPELNGRTYAKLPRNIRAGIDRRSISSIVLITESASSPEEALLLKQLAFERLNTGGVALSRQEVRNCLYQGKFNSLLLELARHPVFADAWEIPTDNDDATEEVSQKLAQNNLYKKMEDAELVLRFFALRHADNFHGGLEKFLDLYMIRSQKFSDEDIKVLEVLFLKTLQLAYKIYRGILFKPFEPKSGTWSKNAYKAYYDAVMVGFSKHLSDADALVTQKSRVIEETKRLFREDKSRLFTGGGKTKADIQKRLKLFNDMLAQVVNE